MNAVVVRLCDVCGEEQDQETFTYTSDGQGPMCSECAATIEAELEKQEAQELYRGIRY